MLAVLPLAAASTAVAGSLAECLADEMITELIGAVRSWWPPDQT